MTALVYRGVRKTFGPTVALENLELTLKPGELVSLLGPSGCGKTTALRIAAGFEKADSGSVSVNDTDITHLPAHKRNMGMVFQSYSLFPNLSVADNVEFGLRTRKMHAPQRAQRSKEVLELVQLGQLANRYPHQLSGGQQQRVALARALAVQPEVLLLDEPLSALDAKVRSTLRDEIRRIQTELGMTTLFVTHDQEEALAISDRVGVMSNGRLEQIDTPKAVYRHPSSAFVARFVGSMNELAGKVTSATEVQVGNETLVVPSVGGESPGSSVLVLVRPEDLQFAPGPATSTTTATTPSAANRLTGTAIASTFQGASTVITVRLDAASKLVAVHLSGSERAPSVGDQVTVEVDTARAVCEPV